MHIIKKIFTDFSQGKVFTVFDTETTGLHPESDIQAAAVLINGFPTCLDAHWHPGFHP